MEAARRVTGRALDKPSQEDSKKQPQPTGDKKKTSQVTFNPNNLEGFNTDKKSIIKNQTGHEDEDAILKTLFVTNPDAEEEFENEKATEIEHTLGKKVAKPDIKQGWGEWAG